MDSKDGNSTNFCIDNWMYESPLINKIMPNREEFIDSQAKVCNFVTSTKRWNLQNLEIFY